MYSIFKVPVDQARKKAVSILDTPGHFEARPIFITNWVRHIGPGGPREMYEGMFQVGIVLGCVTKNVVAPVANCIKLLLCTSKLRDSW